MLSQDGKPTGVLLLNLGGPTSLDEIRPFLMRLFSDSEIIKLPFQKVTAGFLASRRSRKVAGRYEHLGGGSPLVKLTEKQGQDLEEELSHSGLFRVFVGMRYWHPLIEEAVNDILSAGVEHLVVLPLFPQYSKTTTGSCLKELRRTLGGRQDKLKLTIIESWYEHDGYIEALREKVAEGIERFAPEKRDEVQVIFSAHSIPQSVAASGDPYPDQLQATIDKLLERLPPVSWRLTFQSRSGPVRWLGPSTDTAVRELAAQGHKQVLMVPISFVSDHVETLYEMDVLYKDLADEVGLERFERSPSLNSAVKFISALAEIVKKHLEQA